MEEIRKFAAMDKRVETGPIQFGEDWPGLFIRGDNAFAHVVGLVDVYKKMLANPGISRLDLMRLRGIIRDLCSCNINEALRERLLKEVEEE